MTVRVEFLGTPRLYANTDAIECEAKTVAEALNAAASRFPTIFERCFEGGGLRTGFLIGVNSRFDSVKPETALVSGDCVQLLSADVGGH